MTDSKTPKRTEVIGNSIDRVEDKSLLTGDAEYTDDIQRVGMTHMAVLRSQHGHAQIEGIDASNARNLDGVHAIYTAEDIKASGTPGTIPVRENPIDIRVPDRPMLAREKVRYQGDGIAVAVADDRYTAHQAIDRIDVEYERLEAIIDPIDAEDDDTPTIHEDLGTNVAFDWETGDADATDAAFADAAHTVELDLTNNRVIPTPMEPRAAVATYRPSTGHLDVELTTQNPHTHQRLMAQTLGMSEQNIRIRAPDVGGGFGAKITHYPDEALAAWCSMQIERPVKWQATRTEDFATMTHGRNHESHVALAFSEQGRILGYRIEARANLGAYLSTDGSHIPTHAFNRTLPGQYDIPALHARVVGTYTNTAPVDAYRGAGRPEACYNIERAINDAAEELGLDPVEIRRRNFIPPEAFPYEAPTGFVYDSGEYEQALEKSLDIVDYEAFRERQADLREEGRHLGIGFSCYVEGCGPGPSLFESGLVRFKPSGQVVVQVGTADQGQGHATSYAQIAAEKLGVPFEDVYVVEGDTAEVPEGSGTRGSRSMSVGGSAIARSAEKVIKKASRIAAHQMEAAEEDVEFEDGEFRITGAPQRSVDIQTIAGEAYDATDLPDDVEAGLEATTHFTPDGMTTPFGTHVVTVEVDAETGEFEILRYVAVDDCGTQINPKLIEGQVHGSVAQGLGQAMYEEARYDTNGTLTNGSMQDYVVPKAEHVPSIETEETVTPCPFNPLGAKGVGEAGAVAAPPALVNAVLDALDPFDVDHLDMPVTDEAIWKAVHTDE